MLLLALPAAVGQGKSILPAALHLDSNYAVRAGRLGGHSLQVGGNFATQTPDFTAQDTWIVGFGLLFQAITGGSGTQQIFRWQDGATLQCSLSIENNGELKFWRGDSTGGGVLLATSSGAKLRGNVWTYIEVKVKIHNSTGIVDKHPSQRLQCPKFQQSQQSRATGVTIKLTRMGLTFSGSVRTA